MVRAPRQIGDLTFPEIAGKLKASSILCLPIGAIEQHGAHLPLNTDVIISEQRKSGVNLLFDPEHNLEERITKEQFTY